MDFGPSTSKCFIPNDFSKVKAHNPSTLVDDKSHFGLKRSGISSTTKRPRIADDYNSNFADNTSTGSASTSRTKTDDGILRRVTNTVSGLFSNSWSEWLTGSSPSVTQSDRQDSLFNSAREVSSDMMNPGIKKENKLLNQLYPEEGIVESVEKDDNAGLTTSQPMSIENSWPPLKSVISSYKDQSFIASTPSLSPYLTKRGNDDLLGEQVLSKQSTSEFHKELLPPREDSVNLLKHSFPETPIENYSSQINGSISSFPSSRKKLRENIEDEMNNGNITSSESKKRTLTQSQMFTEEVEDSFESMKRKRPRFSISTYGSPFHNKTEEDEPSFSIFYPGKIMYGGASNHQRKRNRIVPRKICPRTPAVVSTNEDDHSDGGLSSAARRILDCIDKISTPLSDSKRAFQFCSPRDFSFNTSTFVSDFHKNRPTVKSNTLNKDTPPVAKLLTPTKVKITKNFSSLFASKTSEMETVVKEATSEKIKKISPECNKTISSSVNTVTQKSSESSLPKKSLDSFFAKEKASNQDSFKNFSNGQNLYSVKSDNISKFPNICSSSSIDNSSISSTVDIHISNSVNKQNDDSLANSQVKENINKAESSSYVNDCYEFSSPSIISDLTILQKLPKSSVEFKFSHPINEAELPSLKEVSILDVKESGYIIKKNKWNCDTCLLQNDDSNLKCIACEAPKPERSNFKTTSATSQNWGNTFKKTAGSWECESCLLQNQSEKEICVACTAAKPKKMSKIPDASSDTKQLGFSGNWGETFKRPEGSWDCPQCLLQNKSSVDKCASCEAPKSTSSNSGNNKSAKPSLSNWGDAFKPSEGSWVCESCLVHNTSNCSNCLCCKAAKPKKENESKAKSSKELASSNSPEIKNSPVHHSLKVNENVWICPECLTTNKNLETKCLNCKCSRPIPPNDLSTKNKEVFQGSFPVQFKKGKDEWECETCCVRNKNTEQKCQSCATPRASLSHSDIVSEALTGNFKFDANSKPKIIGTSSCFNSCVSESTKENSGGFSFGIINPNVTKAENSSNADLNTNKSKDIKSGFNFGVNSSNGGMSSNLIFGANSSKDEKYSKINFDVNPGSIKEGFSFSVPVSKPETSGFNLGVGPLISKDISENIQMQSTSKTSSDGNPSISNMLPLQSSKSKTSDITEIKSIEDNTVGKSLTSPLPVSIDNKTSSSSQLKSSFTNSPSSNLIFGIPHASPTSLSAPFNASDAVSTTTATSTTSFSFFKPSVPNEVEKPSENIASTQESKESKPVFQFGSSLSTTQNAGAKFEFPKIDHSNAKKTNDFFSQGFPKVNPSSFNFFGNTSSTQSLDKKTSLPSFGDSKPSSSIFVFGNNEAKPQNTGFSFGNTDANKLNSNASVFGASSSQPFKFGQQEANKNKPPETASSLFNYNIDALQNPFNASTSGGPQKQRVTKRAHRRLK